MARNHRILLIIDGIINLAMGVLLLAFPLGIVGILGLPPTSTDFYPGILGAVLFGIGIALLIEACSKNEEISGLGIAGAIAINLCGAGVLVIWLVFSPFEIPLRGNIILWSIAIIIFIVAVAELSNLYSGQRRKKA